MIEQEKSLLPILTFDATNSWNDLLKLCSPHLDIGGLSRLKNALGNKTKSVAIERQYIDKDYRDTFSNFHSKRFSTPDSRCIRLHFFDQDIDYNKIINDANIKESYLGYSILRPTRPNSIGRTLLSTKGCDISNAFVCSAEETVSIHGSDFKINGFPFISQDADVTVCAQSAIWMAVRYFSNKYNIYQEWYPFKLAELTKDYSIGRIFPSSGLTVWQISEVLRRVGFSSVLYDRSRYLNFEHLLFTYLESGIPVLATFKGHVVVLCGYRVDHTNSTSAKPIGTDPIVFSSQFLTEFIGNDDNRSPYLALGDTITSDSMNYKKGDIIDFIVPLPEKVFLPAEAFQDLVTSLLYKTQFSITNKSPILASKQIGTRLFLTTCRSFKRKLTSRGMGSKVVENTYRNIPLPHFIWVCEIFDLQAGPLNVLGEVIWDATRNSYEPDGMISVHYPEALVLDAGSTMNGQPNLVEVSLAGSTAYPAYESNLVRT